MAPSDLRQLMELCRKHNRKVLRPLQPASSNSNSSPNKSDVVSSRLASILDLYMSSIVRMGRTRKKRPPRCTPFSLPRYLEDSMTTLWLFSSRAVLGPTSVQQSRSFSTSATSTDFHEDELPVQRTVWLLHNRLDDSTDCKLICSFLYSHTNGKASCDNLKSIGPSRPKCRVCKSEKRFSVR